MGELGASQRQDMDRVSETITRSIEDDIQTEEYRGYRDNLY